MFSHGNIPAKGTVLLPDLTQEIGGLVNIYFRNNENLIDERNSRNPVDLQGTDEFVKTIQR